MIRTDDKVIVLWLMVYDQNPDRTYIFTDKAKVLSSIGGLLSEIVPEEVLEEATSQVFSTLEKGWGQPLIPMKFMDTFLFLYRLELDRHNPVHQVLSRCRKTLDSLQHVDPECKEVIGRIDRLLSDN